MRQVAFATPLALAMALCGCASTLSGIGGTDGYACKAPVGAQCTSVSGVYANSAHGTPVPAKPLPLKPSMVTPAIYGTASIAAGGSVSAPVTSIRSSPRVLRLWIAPWEDADGDLHEESLVHVLVDSGRWLIEHVRPASRPRVDGVAPPIQPVPESSPAKGPSEAPQAPTRFPLPPAGELSGTEQPAMER